MTRLSNSDEHALRSAVRSTGTTTIVLQHGRGAMAQVATSHSSLECGITVHLVRQGSKQLLLTRRGQPSQLYAAAAEAIERALGKPEAA